MGSGCWSGRTPCPDVLGSWWARRRLGCRPPGSAGPDGLNGGNHEWIPVSRGVAAKILGLQASDIHSFVSATGETSGTRVITELDGTTRTEPWSHNGDNKNFFHKRLFEIWESVATATEGRNLIQQLITPPLGEFQLNDAARAKLDLPNYDDVIPCSGRG